MPSPKAFLSKDHGGVRLLRGRLQVAKLALAVRAVRHALDLSQAELASLAGCSRPTIHRLELGLGMTRLNTVESLVAVFRERGVDVSLEGDDLVVTFRRDLLLRTARAHTVAVQKDH